MEDLIEQIGFDKQYKEINIAAKCNFDKIYDSGSQTFAEIAEKISKTWQ